MRETNPIAAGGSVIKPPQGGSGTTQPARGPDGTLLRDWLAGLAMQALVASGDEGAGDRLEDIPGYAYDIADAMLAAREASTP